MKVKQYNELHTPDYIFQYLCFFLFFSFPPKKGKGKIEKMVYKSWKIVIQQYGILLYSYNFVIYSSSDEDNACIKNLELNAFFVYNLNFIITWECILWS